MHQVLLNTKDVTNPRDLAFDDAEVQCACSLRRARGDLRMCYAKTITSQPLQRYMANFLWHFSGEGISLDPDVSPVRILRESGASPRRPFTACESQLLYPFEEACT